MTEWVHAWQTETVPNCKKFTLTAQIDSVPGRTPLCLALFIEDLLGEGYDFVLTSRFQTLSCRKAIWTIPTNEL